MKVLKLFLFVTMLALAGGPAGAANDAAKAGNGSAAPIRIGVLTDMTGSMARMSGHGSVEAAKMAIEDFAARTPNARPIALMTADYQNRGDLAQHISEDWITRQGVDVVVDVPNASITARLQDLFREKNRLMLTSCPSIPPGNMCSSAGISWLYGQDVLATNLVYALLREGKTRWFIIGSDDSYSQNMAAQAARLLQRAGATIVGEAQLARRMSGLDTVLQQIPSDKTDVIFMAFDNQDAMHLLRHWPERSTKVPLAFSAVNATDMLGLRPDAIPFYIITPFYWEQDDTARKWAEDFIRRSDGPPPSTIQASVYSAVTHYLQAVRDSGVSDPAGLMQYMKKFPLNAVPFGPSQIRGDGMVTHRLHLLLSKSPSERKGPWDFFRVVRTLTPAELQLPPEMKCSGGEPVPPPPPPPPAADKPAPEKPVSEKPRPLPAPEPGPEPAAEPPAEPAPEAAPEPDAEPGSDH